MCQTLQLDKFEGADCKSDNIVSNSNPKIPKPQVFGPILEIDKLEDADFKYGTNIFKILTQKYPNNIFLIRNLGVFVFPPSFSSRQIRRS